MAYRIAKDDAGNEIVFRGAAGPDGKTKWIKVDAERIPKRKMAEIRGVPYEPKDTQMERRARTAEYNKGKKLDYQDDVWQTAVAEGKEQLVREAQDMGGLDSAMVHAGREVDKLGAGIKDIALIGAGMMGQDITENLASRKSIADDQAKKDEYYKYLDDQSSWSKIGTALPYFATGVAEPVIAKGLGGIIGAAGRGVASTARATGQMGRASAKELSDISGRGYRALNPPPVIDRPVQYLKEQIKNKYTTDVKSPIDNYVSRVKNREPIETPRSGFGKKVRNSAALGGIEGAAHYDESVMDGMLSSVLGTVGGLSLKNRLSRGHNFNTESENATISKWRDHLGFRPPAGMETGKPEIQQKTSAMRNSAMFSSSMRSLDNANNDAIARHAGKAAGLDMDALKRMDEDSLKAHMQSLKSTFNELEARTSGVVDIDDFGPIISQFDNYPRSVSTRLTGELDKLGSTFDGSTYKTVRSKVKEWADKAADNGDDSYRMYKDFIDALDANMEKSMGSVQGPKAVADWKDARSKYAMTHFLVENGLDANHGVNAEKIASKLMSSDTKRLLTGEGGSIGNFHDIAKIVDIMKKQKAAQLGDNTGPIVAKPSIWNLFNLFPTPADGDPNAITTFFFNKYHQGYPNRTGLLGLPREGLFTPEYLLRSSQQGNDWMRETGEDIYNAPENYVEKAKSMLPWRQ